MLRYPPYASFSSQVLRCRRQSQRIYLKRSDRTNPCLSADLSGWNPHLFGCPQRRLVARDLHCESAPDSSLLSLKRRDLTLVSQCIRSYSPSLPPSSLASSDPPGVSRVFLFPLSLRLPADPLPDPLPLIAFKQISWVGWIGMFSILPAIFIVTSESPCSPSSFARRVFMADSRHFVLSCCRNFRSPRRSSPRCL